jgi:hypothetical protein
MVKLPDAAWAVLDGWIGRLPAPFAFRIVQARSPHSHMHSECTERTSAMLAHVQPCSPCTVPVQDGSRGRVGQWQVFSAFLSYLFSQRTLTLDNSVVSCAVVLSKLYQVRSHMCMYVRMYVCMYVHVRTDVSQREVATALIITCATLSLSLFNITHSHASTRAHAYGHRGSTCGRVGRSTSVTASCRFATFTTAKYRQSSISRRIT